MLCVDSVRMDFQLDQKISKRRFFQDIKNSFQWVIGNGLKPTQFFSFQNISTNTVAREVQSFGQNGPWLAGWLSNGQNFFVNLAQTWDEEMLKISGRYLDSCLSNGQITENLLLPMDPLWTLWPKVSKGGPLATTIFHLIGHYSEMSQDIFLKFSAFVHHMSILADISQNLERL